MAAPKKVDYERIEPGWRAGILSPAQLAAQYTEDTGTPCSRAAIIKHFGKLGVPRDLKAKIQAKADAMVTQAMVTGKVTTETIKRDTQIIDEGATVVATIRISHRADIQRARTLAMTMFSELEAQTITPELFAQIEKVLAAEKAGKKLTDVPRAKLNEGITKTLSLPGRSATLKILTEALKTTVALEREAFGINSAPVDLEDPLSIMLRGLQGKAKTITPVVDDPDLTS